ncbi:septum site-determining protein MinC [Mesorhizobium soli]|jgi:septum site-determining protein MinC|uniref:septum site-determining protein MinC n=1 Tax=Pseudaminobacter soli (ex Li et al. 2025) TaxID=1295366 RepID=UPI002474A326|nr:septum site-determining protein MinC [Mesorhizobium soli]MDH6231515.1 septum site-determining protein MinC [Mesorhizobium soli]
MQNKSIRFRARSFVAFALVPEAPLEEWLQDLDRWIENSPGFFTGRPVVLDLKALKPEAAEIAGLVAQLGERGIRTYAIESKDIDSLPLDLPPLLVGAKEKLIEEAPEEAATPIDSEEPAASNTLIIESPIRSGQSINHPHGDVIILGSASSGSEILAGGSIHVYGTLRGRAFAGAWGDQTARIFCRKNEAELLAIDGWYRTAEDMEPSTRGRPIQAYLHEGVILVAPLK